MNGITIKDKQYVFIATGKDTDCDCCDLKDVCSTSVICESFHSLLYGKSGVGIFKELKVEK